MILETVNYYYQLYDALETIFWISNPKQIITV